MDVVTRQRFTLAVAAALLDYAEAVQRGSGTARVGQQAAWCIAADALDAIDKAEHSAIRKRRSVERKRQR